MSVIVFLGPSLDRAAASAILPATYLPPVSLGDVYAAARKRPSAIAIIDGYFERVPAVWHKEILWAMSRGVHVYGASSMGALRAAELEAFGMVGVGEVFAAFRDRVLEDDDEVALVHAPSEFAYIAGSEAMVNMRATFAAACEAGVISAGTREIFVRTAKAMFYAHRDYEPVLVQSTECGAPVGECAAFRVWLTGGRRDVKRADAIELLTRLATGDGAATQKQVEYTFHKTFMWEELRNTIERRPLDDSPGVEAGLDDGPLEELRLEGDAYVRERDRSMVRLLAVELGSQQGLVPAPLAKHVAADEVRSSHALESLAALEEWLTSKQLAPDGTHRLMEDEAQIRGVIARYQALLPGYLCDHLRVTGRYGDLERRARAKHAVLWRRGLHNPSLADAGLAEPELWQWFFTTLLRRSVPTDLDAASRSLDFAGTDLMRRAALREYLYRQHLARTPSDAKPSSASAVSRA